MAPAAPGPLPGETRIGRLTAELHTPFDAFERASDAVGRGSLKVFEEIGLEFARYLQEHPPDAPAESPSFQRFLDRLRPGDPPDGQRQAFARYERKGLEHEHGPVSRREHVEALDRLLDACTGASLLEP